MIRRLAVVSLVIACAACDTPDPRGSTLKVSYYAQDSAFVDASPLRVTVGSGKQMHSLRGLELASYHPFLVSQVMPLDSAATLPVTVSMIGVADDTIAQARLTIGPVEPATAYTVGIIVGGRKPETATSPCGMQRAVPIRSASAGGAGESLYVSISGVRGGAGC